MTVCNSIHKSEHPRYSCLALCSEEKIFNRNPRGSWTNILRNANNKREIEEESNTFAFGFKEDFFEAAAPPFEATEAEEEERDSVGDKTNWPGGTTADEGN